MIEHIVLIEVPEEAQLRREEIIQKFKTLKGAVPGVVQSTAGTDFSGRCLPYTMAALVEFEGREALAGYDGHPAHQDILDLLQELGCNRIVADFER